MEQKVRYHTDAEYRKVCIEKSRKSRTKYYPLKRMCEKLGDMDRIEQLCLQHGFSPDVAHAIAMDGDVLTEKMCERGLLIDPWSHVTVMEADFDGC